jgi:TetR/AcrR family transcriptional repressor of nem operon
MVRNTNTKRAILDLAESFLQDKGYNGFSYAHIAAELDVKNAAVHYHYPAKDDLARAVIKRYRDRFQLWVNNARVKDLTPDKKLDWFFAMYASIRADHGKVCLVGVMEAEFNSIPESLQEETRLMNRELLAWLEETLQQGRDAGLFHFKGEVEAKAALVLSGVQGALQMARALGAKKFTAVVEQMKQDLLL